MNKKTRDTNIELLRIFAMFLVILTHCLLHAQALYQLNFSSMNFMIIDTLKIISWMSNTIFILISGYYMVNSKFKLKKILNLWGLTLFYSIGIYIIQGLIKGDYENTLYCFFPITKGHYWFIVAYIMLYTIMPALNLGIQKLTQKQFKYILGFLIIIVGIICPFFGIKDMNLVKMIYIYCIGAYIKRFVTIKEKQYYFIKSIFVLLIVVILSFILRNLYLNIEQPVIKIEISNIYKGLYSFTNIFIVLATIFLFMKFKTIKIQNKIITKVISITSSSLFSIYLIHEHFNIRTFIWNELFDYTKYLNSNFLAINIIGNVICIFIICLVIDFVRRGMYVILNKIPCIKIIINKINYKTELIDRKVEAIFKEEGIIKELESII